MMYSNQHTKNKSVFISSSFQQSILQVENWFLPRDATQSAVISQYDVRLSVGLSVTFRYVFHTGWNTSKIISRLISLMFLLEPG